MKLRRKSKSEENRAAAASLLSELEDEETFFRNESVPTKKLGSNQVQTESEVGSKVNSNQVQSGFNLGSSFPSERGKVGSEVGSEPSSNLVQTRFELGSEFHFHRLSPLQQKVLIFFAQQCQLERSKITPPIKCVPLAKSLGASVDGLKTATKRLLKSEVLTIHEYMDGRAGWTRYEIPEHVFKTLVLNKTGFEVGLNQVQSGFQLGSKVGSELGSSRPSSSRDLSLKESTTTQPGVDKSDWLTSIDLAAVQARGVTHSVLVRCLELYPNLEPEKLEQLVFRFGQYLKDPKHKIQNARGFFISLAEQLSKGQTPLDHIETPEDRALRELVSRQDEVRARRAELEAKAFEFEFESWRDRLSVEDRTQLAPENSVVKAGSVAQDMLLKKHFREELWPERRLQILKSVEVSL